MRLDRRHWLAGATALLVGEAHAQTAPVPPAPPAPELDLIELWSGDPPGGGGPDAGPRFEETGSGAITRVRVPCLLVARPERPNGAAVLVAPGGGYLRIDLGHEGVPVAAWLAKAGITAFVLIYRLPGDGWSEGADAPRQDAQRAVRVIRARAAEYGIDPARIGLIGFSAGGHLMGETSAAWDADLYEDRDATDALSAQPALAGLIYPVVSMLAPFDRTITSRRALLGDAPTEALRHAYSVDTMVTAKAAPVFVVQAADDPITVAEHPLLLFTALRRAKVPAELHLFERGGHGFGLGVPGTAPAAWPGLFLTWARRRGFLKA